MMSHTARWYCIFKALAVFKLSTQTVTPHLNLFSQFLASVPLEDGWILLMWDMKAREIHVFDPAAGRSVPTLEKKRSTGVHCVQAAPSIACMSK
jgi:hypothetical protein